MVESREPGEAAAVAGLEIGDVVLEWRQGRAAGDVASPFHLAMVEQDLAPYGPVRLVVERDGRRRTAPVATGRWKIRTRPLLAATVLDRHVAARQALDSGDPFAAAGLWLELADESAASELDLVSAWFRMEAAAAQAVAGQREACNATLADGASTIEDLRLRAAYWERAGEALVEAGQPALAAGAFGAAVEILEPGFPSSTALAFNLVQLAATDFRAHGETAARAVEIYRAVAGDSVEAAVAMAVEGASAYMRSNLETAERRYLSALDLIRKTAPGIGFEFDLLGNLGLVAMRRGDFDGARSFFTRQQSAAARLDPQNLQLAYASNYLGLLAMRLGRYQEARGHYERALEIFRAIGPDGPEVAGMLNNLGNVTKFLGDLPAARRFHGEALQLRRKIEPDGADVAASLHNLGATARLQGDVAAAREFLEQALALKQSLHPGSLWLSTTHFELGELDRLAGDPEAAIAHHERALEIRRRAMPGNPEVAVSLAAIGRAELDRGRPEAAELRFREAIARIETLRQALDLSDEQRAQFKAHYGSCYHDLAMLLIDQGRPAEAWDLLEKGRAGALRAIVNRRRGPPPSVPDELWFAKARQESLVGRLEQRLLGLDPVTDRTELQEAQEQLAAATSGLQALLAEIREAAPRLAELDAPPAMDLGRLRRSLARGTVVLAYSVGTERSAGLVVGAAADPGPPIETFEIPATSMELTARVDRLNAFVARGPTASGIEPALLAQSRRLHDLLVAPVGARLAAAERVLLVPDGPLLGLSFSALALPEPGPAFLGLRSALFVSPSASLAAELGAAAGEAKPGRTVAAFGDPFYPQASEIVREHRLVALPGSRDEVEAIRRLFGADATVFLGTAATEANLIASSDGPDILHCAVHARVDAASPMDSALYFTIPDGRSDATGDGVLTGWEIVDSLRFDAALVVLSSCQTAGGRIITGEGIIGLGRAFQVAGARSVLVSQWEVPDRSTALLMASFYGHLRDGRSTVEALQRARVAVAGSAPELRHPFHWAGFEVRGDWR